MYASAGLRVLAFAAVLSAATGLFEPRAFASQEAGQPSNAAASAAVKYVTDAALITPLLAKMEAAINAGDQQAYLALVHGDVVFKTEQANWAKDFAVNKIASYTLTLEPSTTPESEQQGSQTQPSETKTREDAPVPWQQSAVRIKHTWQMQSWDKPRGLTLWSQFVNLGTAEAQDVRYAGEYWVQRDVPPREGFAGCTILTEPSGDLTEHAAVIAEVFPLVRTAVDEHFGVKLTHQQQIKVYGSMRHLQHSIWPSYADPLSGWNEPGEAIKLLVRGAPKKSQIKPLLAHEYGHVATFTLGDQATKAPWWALEGAADLASSPYRSDAAGRRDRRVAKWHREDAIAPWEAIEAFPLKPEHEKFGEHVYTQGEHMLAYLTLRFGESSRLAFLRALCQGKLTQDASQAAFHMNWSDIDAAWKLSIQQGQSTAPKAAE